MAGRPTKRIDAQELATILSYGDLHGDKAASAKFGVSLRTIQRRRAELKTGANAKLAGLVVEAKGRSLEPVTDLLTKTYEAALTRLDQLLPTADFDQTVSAFRALGDLHLARQALTSDDDDGNGDNRSGSAAQNRGAGPEARTTH